MDFPVGTIFELPVPGSRFGAQYGDGRDEPRSFPAVVLGQFSDGALQLFVFHFEGQFQQVIPASVTATLKVLYNPNEYAAIQERIDGMQAQIDGLLKCVDDLAKASVEHSKAMGAVPEFDMDTFSAGSHT